MTTSIDPIRAILDQTTLNIAERSCIHRMSNSPAEAIEMIRAYCVNSGRPVPLICQRNHVDK